MRRRQIGERVQELGVVRVYTVAKTVDRRYMSIRSEPAFLSPEEEVDHVIARSPAVRVTSVVTTE